LIRLNIDVFSPIPSERVKTATTVNPGVRVRERRANFRSESMVRGKKVTSDKVGNYDWVLLGILG
jgi:hypothetical protein